MFNQTTKGKKNLKFLQTRYEYPIEFSCTPVLIEYDYFLNEKTFEVIKLKVNKIYGQLYKIER